MAAKGGDGKAGAPGLEEQQAKHKDQRTTEQTEEAKRRGEPASEPAADEPADWRALKAVVIDALRRPGLTKPVAEKGSAYAQDSYSLEDAVQEVIAEVHAAQEAGQEIPTGLADLQELLIHKAKRRWKTWRKRSRERRVKLEGLAASLSLEEQFDLICARDERKKFFEELFETLDPEAQLLLDTLLFKGIPFEKTEQLADELMTSPAHVTNMKRRIIRRAKRIMVRLTGTVGRGGTP